MSRAVQAQSVKLRPHHFLCVLGFQGKGYSPAFVKNFWRVIECLGIAHARVEVATGADDICTPCPNNDVGTCRPGGELDEPRIRALDAAYERTLELRPREAMTWTDARHRIAAKVTDGDFERNCAPCSWKKLGYCKSALQRLRSEHASSGLIAAVFFVSAFLVPAFSCAVRAEEIRNGLIPVEKVEEAVLSEKTPKIPALARVLSALAKRSYPQALKELKAIEANAEYRDYFHFLAGQAEAGRMKKASAAKQWSAAIAAGERAAVHFKEVPSTSAFTPLDKKAEWLLAETELALGDLYLKTGNRKRARPAYENGFQRFSERGLLALASKSAVVNYAALCEKKPDDFCTSWEIKLASVLPKPERAKLSARAAGLVIPISERTFSIPYRVDLDLQAFQEAFTKYQAGKFDEAYVAWNELLKKFPRTSIKLRTKFWMGRAAQKATKDAHAETLYREVIRDLPFSYYAMLASWFSNIDVLRMIDAELPLALRDVPLPNPADLVRLRRSETLIASGARELARYELREIRPRESMPNEFLVYLAALNHLVENHIVTFSILTELSARGYNGFVSSFGEKMIFPATFLALAEGLGKPQKLDPYFVLSIMKQESAFSPDAISSSNALGLMQIIPPTARDLDSKVEISELFEPHKNIALGTKYVRQLLNRYKGDVITALAAYNAGPGNADRWNDDRLKTDVAAKNPLTAEEYIELISFRETHDYVQNILRSYYWYTRRARGEAFPSFQALLSSFSTERPGSAASRPESAKR